MGLDFDYPGRVRGAGPSWSYQGFGDFRRRLAKLIGIDLWAMQGFGGPLPWDAVVDPIAPLLNHSDCDGELSPAECATVGPRLRELIDAIPVEDYDRQMGDRLADAMAVCASRRAPLRFW